MNLLIVESPTKVNTISKFLGKEYKIDSSYGHVRDLPKSKLGIDTEDNFEPHYIIPVKSRKRVNALKKEAEKADEIILATDPDREGEAIAWHLSEIFGNKGNIKRIVFHEITESAIQEALKKPREIDLNLVDAQQARRVLDRLVGYKLSPFLWEKVIKRLSAGRVQSAALRLIAEREEEIRAFKPEEYWLIEALLQPRSKEKEIFTASLCKINNKNIAKLGIKNKKSAEEIKSALESSDFSVSGVSKKEVKRNPLPPFITSTLQRDASSRFRFTARQTMRFAQGLYEKGLITYMRTDSLNLSKESLSQAKEWIKENIGKEYVSEAPRFFKTKSKLAQEAHEAIRPSHPEFAPESFGGGNKALAKLEKNEARLYDLIWKRFIASQLPQAVFETVALEIEAKDKKGKKYGLKANGSTMKFDGFLRVWPSKTEEKILPVVNEGDGLEQKGISPSQHFTEPPARYNEASLIKTLEEYGIGRPSTYAPIISVIQDRNYVFKNEARRFQPTEIGETVNKVLVGNFPEIVDVEFTANMENELDNIAEGKEKWQAVIKDFYGPFIKNLEKKYKEVEGHKIEDQKTDETCEKCGKPMVIKYGRFGKFMACSGFPECKNAKSLKDNVVSDDKGEEMKCPKCGEGKILKKRTKKRRFFYGCSEYPKCDYASWQKPEIK